MSSPVILSISTVFALVGIVLAAIAFSTDNWSEYNVDRELIFLNMRNNASFRESMTPVINKTFQYFDRTYGLFRVCFPVNVPDESGSYRSPFGSNCVNIRDYQIPEDETITRNWSKDQRTRMHLMRTTVAFYIVGLFFLGLCLLTGIIGCWRRHAGLILATGILLLFATLFLAAAMAVWHGVDYMSREVIRADGFELTWQPWLKILTVINYGWSYIISWVAIGLILIASLLMLAAYRSMKEEEADEIEKKAAPYMMSSYYDKTALMPYAYGSYPGYGAYPAANPYYPAPYASQYGGSQYGSYAGYGYAR